MGKPPVVAPGDAAVDGVKSEPSDKAATGEQKSGSASNILAAPRYGGGQLITELEIYFVLRC